MKKIWIATIFVAAALGGVPAAIALTPGEHEATASKCDTATVPDILYGDGGTRTGTIPGATKQVCVTATATATDSTVTTTTPGPTTTVTTTVGATTSPITTTTQPTTTTSPPPPPPPSNNCTQTISPPNLNPDNNVNSLGPGAVLCLHAGFYGATSTDTGNWNNFTVSGTASAPITVRSYPGEIATIGGYTSVEGSFLSFLGLKLDGANSTGSTNSCTPYSSSHGVGVTVNGHNDIFNHDEVFSSVTKFMGSGFLISGSNTSVSYSKVHDWGLCDTGHDHGIYLGNGFGSEIHHNWFWNGAAKSGWGVQFYPSESNAHVFANVIDGGGSGFVNCSTGSNNLIENNVVTNTHGVASTQAAGSLVDGCPPQKSTGHIIRNNDQFNNPGGFGACNSPPPGETCSGNVQVDPQYADLTNHNYTVLTLSLAGYGLPTASEVGP